MGGDPGADRERWQVRIRGADRGIRGAGVLLGGKYVLTCAHVIGDAPKKSVLVDFFSEPDRAAVRGAVREDCWFPPNKDERGDLAVLRLDQRFPTDWGCPLYRRPLKRGCSVRLCGFPEDFKNGLWTEGTLAGNGGPGAEWVQLDTQAGVRRVRRGFSGAGVIDQETAAVLGLVVGEYTERSAGLAWMIPVETILGYLPSLQRWVAGSTSSDGAFDGHRTASPDDVGLLRRIAGWCGGEGDAALVVVTGDRESAAFCSLNWSIQLGVRRLRPAVPDEEMAHAPEGTVPPAGSIDLAVDAAGKRMQDIGRLIDERRRTAATEQPITVVIDGIDESVEPLALLRELIKPLIESGNRVLMGFRKEGALSAEARSLLSTVDSEVPGSWRKTLEQRLEDLFNAVQQARREWEYVAERIAGVPELPDSVLSLVRAADQSAGGERSASQLDERKLTRGERELAECRRKWEENLLERNDLRGRLEAYKVKSAQHGYVENIELATLHRHAHDALWRAPCDLPSARKAVREYIDALHQLDAEHGGQ